jgi:hypothetical protein
MKRLLFIALIIALVSPAYAVHFSKQECAVNWFNQGLKEGSEGGPMRSLARMVNECPGYGYQVDKAQYQAGWQQGQARRQTREMQLCNQPYNAFAMGKSNQSYPNVCSPYTYPAFKSEYDRGLAVGQRINSLQERIQELNGRMSNYVRSADLIQMDSGLYRLGSHDKSPQAKGIVEIVNDLVRQKQPLEAELFNLQMIR